MVSGPPAPVSSLSAGVAPNRAPSNGVHVKLTLTSDVADVSEIVFYFPRGVGITNVGIADGTKAGKGTIVVGGAETPVVPTVTAKGLAFTAGDTVLDGVFSQALGRYTAKLRVKVPQPLAAFTRLSLDLKAKTLFSLRSCPLPFRADLIGAKKRILLHRAACRD
ncbi:MAG TPA: hypothetical protein VI300_12270 [Solirubrobacter sp.]